MNISIKLILRIVSITAFVACIIIIIFMGAKINTLQDDLSVTKNNEKAYAAENSVLKNENIAFQFTIDQLEYFNDSLIIKMDQVRKELNIKDKNLKQMQYLLSKAEKKDTVIFRDTIFYNPYLDKDTIIGDEWYSVNLGLKYPNIITVNPKFKSEKYIIVDYRRETVNPPKKCFIARWFQKKHKVIEVEIVEKNPYINLERQRFIEIIK